MNRGSPSTTPRPPQELERVLSNVRWALRKGLDRRELVPMLERLLALAEPGSDTARFAARHLAPLTVALTPWRAALLARRVLRDEDDGATWSVLGLALMVLGHFGAAEGAYRRALALNPDCVSTQHNLGHLLDAGLGRPQAALPYLRRALQGEPGEPEIAGSYAHALARAGLLAEAESVLVDAAGFTKSAANTLLTRWLSPAPEGTVEHPSSSRSEDGTDPTPPRALPSR